MSSQETFNKADVTDLFKRLRTRKDDQVSTRPCRVNHLRFALIVGPEILRGRQRLLEFLFVLIVQLFRDSLVCI
jgi:hypothetical protein